MQKAKIQVGQYCRYRVPNLGTVGNEFIDGRIVALETTTKGVATLVTFVSTLDRKTYTVSPNNLFEA